jgi:hypothetical protein
MNDFLFFPINHPTANTKGAAEFALVHQQDDCYSEFTIAKLRPMTVSL